MELKNNNCCTVLLRGGNSRRMGTDKAFLLWKGKTYLRTISEKLDSLFDEKYLSVAADRGGEKRHPDTRNEDCRELSSDWIILPDRIPDCGPMSGIWTALETCRSEWALICPCDLPAVETELFQLLLENRAPDADLVYPVTQDGMHLTCAIYRKTLAPVIGTQIRTGDFRLRRLLKLCRGKPVQITDPEYVRMLTNVNTEQDRVKAELEAAAQ